MDLELLFLFGGIEVEDRILGNSVRIYLSVSSGNVRVERVCTFIRIFLVGGFFDAPRIRDHTSGRSIELSVRIGRDVGKPLILIPWRVGLRFVGAVVPNEWLLDVFVPRRRQGGRTVPIARNARNISAISQRLIVEIIPRRSADGNRGRG